MFLDNVISSLTINILTVDRVQPSSWWNYPQVTRPFNRLYMVVDGEAFVRYKGIEHRMTAGCMLLLPCFIPADLYCPKWFDVYYISFNSRLSGGVDLFALQKYNNTRKAEDCDRTWFDQLLALSRGKDISCDNINIPILTDANSKATPFCPDITPANHIRSQALIRLLIAPFVASGHGQVQLTAEHADRMQIVLEYIDNHLSETISLEDLGTAASLTPTYLSDWFHRIMGIRPIDYINRRRTEEAQLMLVTTTMSVKQIAYELGFSTPHYFSYVFKMQTGVTASRYRELQQQITPNKV